MKEISGEKFMDITWLGHSSFKIRGKEGTVVTDPFDPKSVGLEWKTPKADVVTVSHGHHDHNNVEGVQASAGRSEKGIFVVEGPGEYEVQGIVVRGWSTFHDEVSGKKSGKNVVYLIEMERIKVLHLGDLGHELSAELLEDIGQVDVLLVPVGGVYTIDSKTAAKVSKAISPAYVVPMHYQVRGLAPEVFKDLTGVDEFLKEMDVEKGEPMEKLSVAMSSLPEDTQVVVLKL